MPDFANLDDRALLRVVGSSANLFWKAGDVIFEKDSPPDALFIVLSGRVRIVDDAGLVAEISPGGFFGELALLEGATHSKGAEAAEDAELMVVPKEWFESLLECEPELAGYFRRLFEERRKAFSVRGTPASSAP